MSTEDIEVTLASLAGLDATDFAEVRFSSTPAGVYVFEGVSGLLEAVGKEADKKVPVAEIKVKIIEVIKCNDDTVTDPNSLIGKEHRESVFLAGEKLDSATQIGRLKALISDMGLSNLGPIGGRPMSGVTGFLDNVQGARFEAEIVVTTSSTDSTKKYSNMRFKGKAASKAA